MSSTSGADANFSWGRARQQIFIYGLLAPAFGFIVFFLFFPAIYAFYTSLHQMQFLTIKQFVGFHNFLRVFADSAFGNGVEKTFVYGFASLVIAFSAGLGFALWVNHLRGRFRILIQILVLVPWIMPMIVGSLLWRWLLDGQYGVIMYGFQQMGIRNVRILENPGTAMGALIFVASWRTMAFAMLLLLAGIQGIPRELYESAQTDGASTFDQFRFVTMPLLRIPISITLVVLTMSYFNVITVPLALTGGGPGNSTNVLSLLLYRKATVYYDFGFANALALIMFGINLLLVLAYIKLTKVNLS